MSVNTIHRGFSYQHVYSFWELLRLLDEESDYERGRVEDYEAEHVDDVTLHPRAGTAAPARFIQVKWHVDLRDTYSFASLCAVKSDAATSLLQKFFTSWRALRDQGDDPELWLVSTWPAHPELGKHIRGARFTDDLLAGGPRSKGGKALAEWAGHLECEGEELRSFARCLRFRLGLGDDLLTELFHGRMRAHGLRTGNLAMQQVDTLVREWVKDNNLMEIRAETLRQAIAERKLAVDKEEEPSVCLWIHGWSRRDFQHPATTELDWTEHFDRSTRRIATDEDWQTKLWPALAEARGHCERARAGFVDVRGQLPLTAALATGAALPTVAGYRLRYEQYTQGRTELWRSDVTPSRLTWRTEVIREWAAGSDNLVALAITGDGRADVKRFVNSDAAVRAGIGRAILATPDTGAGDDALQGDADAVALANEARKLIKQERQRRGAARIHLLLYGPAGFALFLGQRLNAIGCIVTYERTKDDGYQPSIVLDTR